MTDYNQIKKAIVSAKIQKFAQTKTASVGKIWQAIRRNPGKSTAAGAGAAVAGAGAGTAAVAPGLIDRGREAVVDSARSASTSMMDTANNLRTAVEEGAPEVSRRLDGAARALKGESAEDKIHRVKQDIRRQWRDHKGKAGDAWQYAKDKAGDAWQYAKDNPGRVAGGAAASIGAAGLLYWLLNRRKEQSEGQDKEAQVGVVSQQLTKHRPELPDNQRAQPSPALQQFRQRLHQAQARPTAAPQQPDPGSLAPAEVGKPGSVQPAQPQSAGMSGAIGSGAATNPAAPATAHPY